MDETMFVVLGFGNCGHGFALLRNLASNRCCNCGLRTLERMGEEDGRCRDEIGRFEEGNIKN
jgi:hypothetical protein